MPDRDLPDPTRSRDIASSVLPALLGILLVVGIILWVRQLILVSVYDAPVADSTNKPHATQHTTIDADVRFDVRSGNPRETSSGPGSDRHGERQQSTDPLVRSAEVVAIESNPFGIDQVRHEARTHTEDASGATPRSGVTMSISGEQPSSRSSLDGAGASRLVLQSTIVGEKRRAALINNKLLREGTVFHVDGQVYRLKQVFRGHVVLEQNGRIIEVELSRYRSPVLEGARQLGR